MSESSPSRKPVIGLVGGIGSGKSAVAAMFASLNCAVIDADQIARQELESNEVRQTLVGWWGDQVLNESGQVDRAAVAHIVFENAKALADLEGLVHPRVNQRRRALREKYQQDAQVVAIVEDCPLLLEKALDGDCDAIVFVDTDLATRRRRVAERGWDNAELDRREKSQMGLDSKAVRADYVINNNVGKDESLFQTRRVLSEILQKQSM